MDNAELYHGHNTLQRRDSEEILLEYANKIKWKVYGEKIVDIGCGDGSVTCEILAKIVPRNYQEIVGCDISEKMIDFARTKYGNGRIKFKLLDIEGELPNDMKERFDHVFSFYCLQWIKNQKLAFTNISNLLREEGDCLLVFVKNSPTFDVNRIMRESTKWHNILKGTEINTSPYQDFQEPEQYVEKIMQSSGFVDTDVKLLQKTMAFTFEEAKSLVLATSPFKIPREMQAEYFKDYLQIIKENNLVGIEPDHFGEPTKIFLKYQLLVAYGVKKS